MERVLVEFSEWATLLAHVPKADGTTRSCGDYAVTVNPQLKVPQHPIPLPEDVFVKLHGGQRFNKLDLKSIYQELPLDPDSQQFVTINTHRGLYHYKRLPFGIAGLRAFLGKVNYHDKFIRNLSSILHPLNQLLQKNQDFTWTS